MTILQAILLGIIQGLTEFLPISSSAHLVLTPALLRWEQDIPFAFDVLVQVGTLVAVIVYFWQDLLKIGWAFLQGLRNRQPFAQPDSRLGWFLILASIPAGVLGLALKDRVEEAFNSPIATALFLLGTAALLMGAERIGKRQRGFTEISWLDAIWMGLFQALAIFPGISRSGATMSGGLFRHLDRPSAARFSFLMSIPIMLAAGLAALVDFFQSPDMGVQAPAMLAGFITSMIVGYLSIRWLLSYLSRHSFYLFAGYCVGLSGLALLILSLRG